MSDQIKTELLEARRYLIRATASINTLKETNQQANFLKRLASIIDSVDHATASLDSSQLFSENMQKMKQGLEKMYQELTPTDCLGKLREIIENQYPPATDYKIMVSRVAPNMLKDVKISGYLRTYGLPTSIPDIIEDVGNRHGGGKYELRIIDDRGKFIKSKTFEIAGIPKIPEVDYSDQKDDDDDGLDPVKEFFGNKK